MCVCVCVCACKKNLALNNQQELICHKTQQTNQYIGLFDLLKNDKYSNRPFAKIKIKTLTNNTESLYLNEE